MKKTAILFIITAMFFTLAPVKAFANSAQMHWSGTTASGAVVQGENCPIIVQSEDLTFNVQSFPSNHYFSKEEFLQYDATVTASYNLYNPADYDVTVRLAFPFGEIAHYAYVYNEETEREEYLPSENYSVTLDGQELTPTLRHTYQGSAFDAETDVEKLKDDYKNDGFFTKDLPVRLYKYSVSGIDTEKYRSSYTSCFLSINPAESRIIMVSYNGYSRQNDGFRAGAFVENGDTIALYVLGKDLPSPPEFTVYENGGEKKKIGGRLDCYGKYETTLFDFIMEGYASFNGISEVDYYNAVVDYFENSGKDTSFLSYYGANYFSNMLMQWYEYEITVPAGQTAVNEVTAPLLPSIDISYTPGIFGYRYLLSPAKAWADFGNLNVKINTPYHITSCNIQGFEKVADGYEISFDALPDGELAFSLCSSPNPTKIISPYSFNDDLIFIIVGIIIVLDALFITALAFICVLIRKRLKRKGEDK